jgi:hypothetical protein
MRGRKRGDKMEKNRRETKSPGCSERRLLTYDVSLMDRPRRLLRTQPENVKRRIV